MSLGTQKKSHGRILVTIKIWDHLDGGIQHILSYSLSLFLPVVF